MNSDDSITSEESEDEEPEQKPVSNFKSNRAHFGKPEKGNDKSGKGKEKTGMGCVPSCFNPGRSPLNKVFETYFFFRFFYQIICF